MWMSHTMPHVMVTPSLTCESMPGLAPHHAICLLMMWQHSKLSAIDHLLMKTSDEVNKHEEVATTLNKCWFGAAHIVHHWRTLIIWQAVNDNWRNIMSKSYDNIITNHKDQFNKHLNVKRIGPKSKMNHKVHVKGMLWSWLTNEKCLILNLGHIGEVATKCAITILYKCRASVFLKFLKFS